MAENENENKDQEQPEGRDFRVEGNDTSAYVGTSPEYMTYANETEQPHAGEGAEAELQKQQQDADEANASEVEEPELISPAAGTRTHADPLNYVAESVDDFEEPRAEATTASNENDGVSETEKSDDEPQSDDKNKPAAN